MKRPFELVAEIQDKDAEIERLKAEVNMMSIQAIQFRDLAQSHAALLILAANALQDGHGIWLVLHENCKVCKLISELRKAAE